MKGFTKIVCQILLQATFRRQCTTTSKTTVEKIIMVAPESGYESRAAGINTLSGISKNWHDNFHCHIKRPHSILLWKIGPMWSICQMPW